MANHPETHAAIEQVQKLIALALNNPAPEEARSAAMMALRLMDEHNLHIGGAPAVTLRERKWQAPDATVDEILRTTEQKATGSPDDPFWKPHQAQSEFYNKVAITDTEIDDDFMRKRINAAWRALREERERFASFIREFNRDHHTSYSLPDWSKIK